MLVRSSLSFVRVLFLIVLMALSSCSAINSGDDSRIKLASRDAIKIDLTVTKSDLSVALGDEHKTSKLRAVPVFQNSATNSVQQSVFRLFEVEEGSVYDLLGLKEADILVSINERVVVAPHVLGQIVRLLPKENSIKLEVLRGGKSYLISTKLISQ
jgi:hypothetical protein